MSRSKGSRRTGQTTLKELGCGAGIILGVIAIFCGVLFYNKLRVTPRKLDVRLNGEMRRAVLVGDHEFVVNVWHQEMGALKNGKVTVTFTSWSQGSTTGPSPNQLSTSKSRCQHPAVFSFRFINGFLGRVTDGWSDRSPRLCPFLAALCRFTSELQTQVARPP